MYVCVWVCEGAQPRQVPKMCAVFYATNLHLKLPERRNSSAILHNEKLVAFCVFNGTNMVYGKCLSEYAKLWYSINIIAMMINLR